MDHPPGLDGTAGRRDQPGAGCRRGRRTTSCDDVRTELVEPGHRRGPDLQLVAEQLVVEHVAARQVVLGGVLEHLLRARNGLSAHRVDQQQLLLDPDRAHHGTVVPPGTGRSRPPGARRQSVAAAYAAFVSRYDDRTGTPAFSDEPPKDSDQQPMQHDMNTMPGMQHDGHSMPGMNNDGGNPAPSQLNNN